MEEVQETIIENKGKSEIVLDIIRYIFTIPCALIGGILGTWLLPYLFTMYWLPGSLIYEIVYFIVGGISMVCVPMAILYYMPPKKFPKAIITLSIIWLVLYAVATIATLFLDAFSWTYIGYLICQTLGVVWFIAYYIDLGNN